MRETLPQSIQSIFWLCRQDQKQGASLFSHSFGQTFNSKFCKPKAKDSRQANWTSFKKRESTSDLSTMGTVTCYLTWSQLPFRFCLVLELQGVPNSMRSALIRFLGLAGEKGPGRKKSVRDALPRVNTSWSYRVNVHRLVLHLVDTQLFIWRCAMSTIKIPRSPKTRRFWLEGMLAVGGLPTQLEDLV